MPAFLRESKMLTLRRLSRLLVVLVLFAPASTSLRLPSSLQADEPAAPADPIEDRLETARETYRTKIASLKKDVLDSLDTKTKAARKKKDNKAVVDKLTVEKDNFGKDINNLPASLSKSRELFAKRMRTARSDLMRAYGQAIHDYTGAGKDAQADSIKAEREQFLLKTAVTAPYRRQMENTVEQPISNIPAPRRLLFDPNILVSSAWDFTIIGETTQKGGFKIVDCQIRLIDTDQPAGFAEFYADGQLHLVFQNHRKIPSGEAVVVKVANGQGRGILDYTFGVFRFELVRK
jgi:ABC-type transporter MlaC component